MTLFSLGCRYTEWKEVLDEGVKFNLMRHLIGKFILFRIFI